MSVWIIGDVHGCFDTLQALLAKLPKDAKVVFAGDLIDRGPKSREVVEFVRNSGYQCVRGNHEQMMLDEGLRPRFSGIWLPNGGDSTLQSYKRRIHIPDYPLPAYELAEDEFKAHMQWLSQLPVYLEFPDVKNEEGRHLVVSHSNIGKFWKYRNDPARKQMFEQNVMWDRSQIRDEPTIYNVVGHTPIQYGPRITKIYANVDTGCCFRLEGYGVLTALRFPEMEVIQQENIDVPPKGIY